MKSTRLHDDVFLIGIRDLESLSRLTQLPTVRQVLQRYHQHLNETKSVRNASHLTINEVCIIWSKAAIPTTIERNAIEKLEKIHSRWLLLKKNKRRNSEAQRDRELQFTKELDTLFDIAHADALTMVKISEDHEFLLDQRCHRNMFMSTIDKDLAKKQERYLQRHNEKEERQRRAQAASTSSQPSVSEIDLNEDTDSENMDYSDEEFKPSKVTCTNNYQKKNTASTSSFHVFTPHVTSALDRNKTSDREAVRLIVPLAAALGHDPSNLPVSRSTIRRMRKKARKDHAETVRGEFAPKYPLVVHWDGKILPEIFGEGRVDRLPVSVSGDGMDKLLGVPKLENGSGQSAANAVYKLLDDWSLVHEVQAMSFDTTSANTGRFNGACVLVEQYIGRELLRLACRHHVLELILAKVFDVCCGPSSSPDVPIFKRFKVVWNELTRGHYRGLELQQGSEVFVEPTIACLQRMVGVNSQSRDDYQELIELTLVVLGHPPTAIHWRAPGAIHHARWMSKLLYAFKIYLFREQTDIFKLTKTMEAQMKRFVQFGALLYTRAWVQAPLATEAPGGDLQLWLDLCKYQEIDPMVGVEARNVLERHLWYLSDELVGLALFSNVLSPVEKTKIVNGMATEPSERNVRGNVTILKSTSNPSLGVFATKRTLQLLHRLKIGEDFLKISPAEWSDNEEFLQGQRRLQQLQVVNDTAERAVKLFEEYNRLLTNNEEEKQLVLQVVEANRKAIPTETTKKNIVDTVLPHF